GIGGPVHYLPEGPETDDLEVRVDGTRISFRMQNQHQIIPAGNGSPREEIYKWDTKAHLDGLDVVMGIPPDAPRIFIAEGEELPCLVCLIANLDYRPPHGNGPLSNEVWDEVTTDS